MRSNKKPSLVSVLNEKLSRYSIWTGFFLALTVGSLVGGIFFYVQAKHNRALLVAMSQNVGLLAQNSDYREIERVLSSAIKGMPSSSIYLVKNEIAQVSVPDSEQMQTHFTIPHGFDLMQVRLANDGNIYSSLKLEDTLNKTPFGELVLKTPTHPVFINGLIALCASFGIVFLIMIFWRKAIRRVLRSTLSPLNQLHKEIQAVGRGEEPTVNPDIFAIEELSEISSLLHKQYQDIQKLTNQAADAEGNRRLQQGMRSLLHDLLNPYTALGNLIEARVKFPDDAEVKEQFEGRWPILNQQIRDLLQTARHFKTENPKLVEANLLESIREGAMQGASDHSDALSLDPTLTKDAQLLAKHDPTFIRRAVSNLVRNAVEEGASKVKVWCDPSPLSIHVQDNGPGIPDDKVAALFEGRLKTGKTQGSGIGFPTVLRLIEAHNGRILLERSGDRRGAHFKIDLSSLEMCL